MVGVSVSVSAVGQTPVAELDASDQFFVAGVTSRGATDQAILVRSMVDVETYIGPSTPNGFVYETLSLFFNEGGQQAYVSRVVSTGVASTLTLNDRKPTTPAATLVVAAASPGTWGNTLKVEVKDGSVPNSFRIIVTLNGVVVDDANGLLTPSAAVARFSTSPWIRVTDSASATAPPGNIPAVLPATSLTGGAETFSATTPDYVDALARFGRDLGPGCVAIPGLTAQGIYDGIDAHCRANNRIGILGAAKGATKTDLITAATAMNTEWCGLFAPWLNVSDGYGGLNPVPCEGAVAGLRAGPHRNNHPERVPAGKRGETVTPYSLFTVFSGVSDYNDLNAARVSMFRNIQHEIELYGYRSLSYDNYNWSYLSYRDLCNWLVMKAENHLEDYVFRAIDAKGRVQAAIKGDLIGVLEPIKKRGGLYPYYNSRGKRMDPGYRVQVGDEVNTPQTKALGEVRAIMKVRFSPIGEQITLLIVKYGQNTRMSEEGY